MKVLLASPRGFCAGVDMAIECLDEAIRCVGPEIFVYHEIVHNKIVVDRFEKLGVTFVETLDEVPHGSILVFSAHGVSPEVRREAQARRLQTIDAIHREENVRFPLPRELQKLRNGGTISAAG
jgi:4-hydroxy-3-methylbut-2-enyl diphosphate reductase